MKKTFLCSALIILSVSLAAQTLQTVVSNGNTTTLPLKLFGRTDFGELYDSNQYGAVQITRDANQGSKFHLSFIRNGSIVYGMGFLNNSNVFGIQPGANNGNSYGIFMAINGNTGIGAPNPLYMLDVHGTSSFTDKAWFSYGNPGMSGYSWTDAALTTNSIEIVNQNSATVNSAPTLAFHAYGSGGPQFRLAVDGSKVLYLESAGLNSARSTIAHGGGPNEYFSRLHVNAGLTTTGNVGIGTDDPKGYKLAVAGNMIAESVKVKLQSAWPDYVFTKDYELSSLEHTEQSIKLTGHLPGIPSAKQIQENGLDLGEMNAKLLEKIEELTLYIIEIKKQLNQQDDKIKALMVNVKKELNGSWHIYIFAGKIFCY